MKFSLGFCVGVLFVFLSETCCVCSSHDKTSVQKLDNFEKIVNTVYKSTVKVQTKNIGGKYAVVASGFAIDKERIITAGHFCLGVVNGSIKGELESTVDISFVNNNDEISIIEGGTIEAIDEKMDICVVKKSNHGIIPLKLKENYNDVKIHDKIVVVGGPLGFFPVTSIGRVIDPISKNFSLVDLNNRLVLFVTATYGNSGGPVLDENGNVIGIVMAKVANFDHILLAVTSTTIQEFLKQEYGPK